MELSQQQVSFLVEDIESHQFKRPNVFLKQFFDVLFSRVKTIGYTETMEDYDRQKLGIFNLLNFFQLLTGILVSLAGFLMNKQLPASIWLIACLPALVSVLVLYLNKLYKYETALLAYFILYPFFTCVVYIYGLNLGINLFFILFGILSVFFLREIGYMLFLLSFSMVSYFTLAVVIKSYRYELQNINTGLYLFNQGLAIVLIFYGLYLIKKENAAYQVRILNKNKNLQQKNIQIQEQADKIREDAAILKKQTEELTELNALKNKLFSIISHDLKAPMYAMRNLFSNLQQRNTSPEDFKEIIPEVVNDLNYTTGLMDNLLQWAKTQMQSDTAHPQKVDIGKSISEVVQLLRLQSEAKQIRIEKKNGEGVYGYMDKDMLNLVLRNLISNAIKFTPENGNISVEVYENNSFVEVNVQDNGPGISQEALSKINGSDFYTTRGTANETGTGLGIMLCKEFLAKNGGRLYIESKMGEGSVFSFSFPKSA